jgi:4-hydroxybenzoyl-CoA thioesterase
MYEQHIEINWGECDLAGLVYFPRLLEYCHRALEGLFAGLDGGYARLTGARRIGIPTVHLSGDFTRGLRYGQCCVVQVRVQKIGTKSVTFEHQVRDKANGELCARFAHVVAVCALRDEGVSAIEIPDDVRALLAEHLLP